MNISYTIDVLRFGKQVNIYVLKRTELSIRFYNIQYTKYRHDVFRKQNKSTWLNAFSLLNIYTEEQISKKTI